MVNLQKVLSYFEYLDIYGIPIQPNFQKNFKFRSNFSTYVSLFIIAISIYFLIKQFIGWFQVDVSTIINSSENFSVASLLNENRSIEYNIDYSNYGIYFSMYATLPDLPEFSYKKLEKYFKIEYKYSFSSTVSDQIEIESEDCNERKINDFLKLNYYQAKITEDMSNPWRICVKNPLKMGLFPQLENAEVFVPSLYLQIKPCQNSSLNKNFCASTDEIKEMKKYITVQSSIPKTIYDFKNQSNSIKRLYKYEVYNLDLHLKKVIKTEVNPTFLYKDCGLLNDDYILDSINFNPGQQSIDFNSKDENENVLFEYQISISYQIDKYYIRNQKLNETLGSFGGMISILYHMGSLICLYINRILFTNSLIYLAFNVGDKTNNVIPLQ